MFAGDESNDDFVTSGPTVDDRPSETCAWCEDWADGFDPEPCPKHDKEGAAA